MIPLPFNQEGKAQGKISRITSSKVFIDVKGVEVFAKNYNHMILSPGASVTVTSKNVDLKNHEIEVRIDNIIE